MTNAINPDVFAQLKLNMPKMASGFAALQDTALEGDALDSKIKYLTALAIAVARGNTPASELRMDEVVNAGATLEEIAEALGMAMFMGGELAVLNGQAAYATLAE